MLFDDVKAMNKSRLVALDRPNWSGLPSEGARRQRHTRFLEACKSASVRAVKEVRVVASDSEAVEKGVLSSLMASGVRVLHLLRDPRGVLNSRLKLWQFCKASGVVKCSSEVCGSYRSTLDAIDAVSKDIFPSAGVRDFATQAAASRHYMRIKYEDVATEPVRMLGAIYEWAGIGGVEPRIAKWLYATTHATKSDNDFRIQVRVAGRRGSAGSMKKEE